MKSSAFLIFFSIVTTVYFIGSYYIFNRLVQALPHGLLRTVSSWAFWLVTSSFMVAQFLERTSPHFLKQVLSAVGSTWLVMLLYLLMFLILVDLVRLANYFFGFLSPEALSSWFSPMARYVAGLSIAGVLVLIGLINAANPAVKQHNITINKSSKYEQLKVALVTDIHMGAIIGHNRLGKLVDILNTQNPDVVLFAGDLVDHNPVPVMQKDMGKHFGRINAPLGMYAVTGNHEYIGHAEITIDYLSGYGINYVRDTSILVDNAFYLIGREDMQINRFSGERRKSMASLIPGENHLPKILLDHQPVEYPKAQELGIDLMLSGHTHKGQLWPFNYITRKVYENDYGLLQKGKSWFYTSSGYGTWGPPVRLGNRPEVVIFNLNFKK